MEHSGMDADDPGANGCLSPDQENCENSHDDQMYLAINRFIGTQEQSYEEFLSGFTCLTIDDVTKYRRNTEELTNATDTPISEGNGYHNEQIVGQTVPVLGEDIEEEVLVEGSVHGTMSTDTKRNQMVKFDNFVEADDEELDTGSKEDRVMEELLATSGYSASFLECGSGETTNTKAADGLTDELSPSSSDNTNTTTNFGEVETEEDISHLHEISDSHTVLDIISSNPCNMSEKACPDEVSSEDVEEFHLDPDFDYDNVKLTPKYSEDDLRMIMSGLKKSPVGTAH
ncbi:intraflagellar transport-associated protein-like [Liolophura sinensis]|uniref:intraflagellar transport-associated protein-like n=1 Tax=Liolophura sinensis TaxID=3198878 RepID=UPI003159094D